MMSEESLTEKLRDEGFDLDNCSTDEKVLYVWKLYLSSEVRLYWNYLMRFIQNKFI